MTSNWKATLKRIRASAQRLQPIVNAPFTSHNTRKWVLEYDDDRISLMGYFQGLTSIEVVHIVSQMTNLIGQYKINYSLDCLSEGKVLIQLYEAKDQFLKLILSSQDIILENHDV